MKDKKNWLIGALLIVIVSMAVGYAAFATTLNINGNAVISGNWNVEITGIQSTLSGTATNKDEPTFTATSATFSADLLAPGDSVLYDVTVKNSGNIKAKLDSITLSPDDTAGSPAIKYSIVSQPTAGSILAPQETTQVQIKVEYLSTVETVPDVTTKAFTGVLNYVQAPAQ